MPTNKINGLSFAPSEFEGKQKLALDDFVGKTFVKIGMWEDTEISLIDEHGNEYSMYISWVEESFNDAISKITGDLNNLIGDKIIQIRASMKRIPLPEDELLTSILYDFVTVKNSVSIEWIINTDKDGQEDAKVSFYKQNRSVLW